MLSSIETLKDMDVSSNSIHLVQFQDVPHNLTHLYVDGNPLDESSLKALKEMPFWLDVAH